MRTRAMALRILNQIRHDKRTVALILIGPIIILTLLYFVLNQDDYTTYKIGVVNGSKTFVNALNDNDDYNIEATRIKESDMASVVRDQKYIATVKIDGTRIKVDIDGTNASSAKKIQAAILTAALKDVRHKAESKINDIKDKLSDLPSQITSEMPSISIQKEPSIDANYIYGTKNGSIFDNYGAPLVGIIIFFLVFLIAGINFLGERSSGTLEKLLSTPIRRHEIILGYTLGFSVLAILQSVLITWFTVYILKLPMEGSIWYVLLINLLTAICALTLGMLLSTLANSEFQMMQFIPLVILPQVFFCGLFTLSGGWKMVEYIIPLHYTADALSEVMVRGYGIGAIWVDLLVLVGLCILFMAGNSRLLRKMRAI